MFSTVPVISLQSVPSLPYYKIDINIGTGSRVSNAQNPYQLPQISQIVYQNVLKQKLNPPDPIQMSSTNACGLASHYPSIRTTTTTKKHHLKSPLGHYRNINFVFNMRRAATLAIKSGDMFIALRFGRAGGHFDRRHL